MKATIIRTTLISAFVIFECLYGKAQVTIGSVLDPVTGALLELKDHASTTTDSTNASLGGLLLPRVRLVDKNTLQPFIATGDTEWNVTNQAKTRTEHIGLTVYNLATTGDFQAGIYVWTTGGWRQMEIASGFIYAPSFNLPWNATSFNIYDVYKDNFKPAVFSRYASNKGINVATGFVAYPDFEATATDFYYVVTDYDPAVLTINSISNLGVISYQKTDPLAVAPPEDAYINVVMIRK